MMQIQPYKSVGSIRFGADVHEVHSEVGDPKSTSKDRRGNAVLRYQGFSITLADVGVVEVAIFPETPTSISGIEIYCSASAFEELCKLDGNPMECLGFIVLLNLGITITGFHDHDESQKAVTAFARGRWDVLESQMKPYVLRAGPG